MTTRFRSGALVAGLALALAACTDPTVPDLNNPSVEGILTNPSAAQVQAMATGIIIGDRASIGPQIRDEEIFGRDMYNLDAADPRWVSELLVNLDPGGFGGNHWGGRYRTIKGANIMIASVATSQALSAEEKSAATGFAKTMKAYELFMLAESRDSVGIASDAAENTNTLAPIVCRGTALSNVVALLDEGRTDLLAGGSSFPFELPSGFAGFDTPASFATFNRAIAAKAEIYRGKTDPTAFNRALTALGQSFYAADTSKFDVGPYHVFSLASGDATNPLFQDPETANFRAHPSVLTDAQPGDRRVAAKVATGASKTYQGLSSDIVITRYAGTTSSIPIIRNEELVLLHAQAELGLATTASRLAAVNDLNLVRSRAGLTALSFVNDQATVTTQLLREKRYSLLFESGSRWADYRLYGRLGTLPLDRTGDKVHPVFPIPQNEQLARSSITCTGN